MALKEQDKIPVTKMHRASKFVGTGAKIGANYLKHYGKKLMNSSVTKEELHQDNANDIYQSLSQLKGSALKVAQMGIACTALRSLELHIAGLDDRPARPHPMARRMVELPARVAWQGPHDLGPAAVGIVATITGRLAVNASCLAHSLGITARLGAIGRPFHTPTRCRRMAEFSMKFGICGGSESSV